MKRGELELIIAKHDALPRISWHQDSDGDYVADDSDTAYQKWLTNFATSIEQYAAPVWTTVNYSDKATLPPTGEDVLCLMTYDNKKFEPIYIVAHRVDEDDCDWRTSDGAELSYWVNITAWQRIASIQATLTNKGTEQ